MGDAGGSTQLLLLSLNINESRKQETFKMSLPVSTTAPGLSLFFNHQMGEMVTEKHGPWTHTKDQIQAMLTVFIVK